MKNQPTTHLFVNFDTKRIIVFTETGRFEFANRSEAYEAYPELRPAPAAVDRKAERREASGRVQGGIGYNRSGKRS